MRKPRILAVTAIALVSAVSILAADGKRCNASPDKCEHQIREMLSGARYLGVKVRETRWGIEIESVTPGSPAAREGLRSLDRIIAINGRDCTKARIKEFKEILGAAKKSGRVSIAVVRDGGVAWAHARVPAMTKQQVDKVISAHLKEAHSEDNSNR